MHHPTLGVNMHTPGGPLRIGRPGREDEGSNLCGLRWSSTMMRNQIDIRTVMLFMVGLITVPAATFAQTDEIQVYDAEIEAQGEFN